MGKKILIVDDSLFIRFQLKNILGKLGHEIVGEAVNGREAIVKYQELKPEIVLLDITMPEMNGIVALSAIKKINAQAIVIMLSAMGNKYHVLEALKLGAKEFIVKPIDAKRLQEGIDDC